jgi:hypothetical protein
LRVLVLKFFFVCMFLLPCAAATGGVTPPQPTVREPEKPGAYVPRPHLMGRRDAKDKVALPGDGNLPEASSSLPLLSAISAGALLAGLLSTRKRK